MLSYESRYRCVVIYVYGNQLGLATTILNEKEGVKGTEIEKLKIGTKIEKQANELQRH